MADNVNNIIYKVHVDTKTGKVNIDGVTKSFEKADQAFLKLQKDVAKGIPNATKSLKGLGDASGSATSATMELSRVISDAPYGIRGMANNITQLVSQMGTASVKAGGLGKALKLMWKQLMGPLGIVLAITAAVSALDYFKGGMKSTKKEADTLNETFGAQSTKLLVLKRALDSSSVSIETKNELVKAANEEYKDLNIQLDDNNNLTDDSSTAINKLSLAYIKNAKAKAIAALIQEEMTKQAKEEAKDAGESLKWYEAMYFGLQARVMGISSATTSALKSDKENKEEVLKESVSMVDKYMAMLTDKGGELALSLFTKVNDKSKDKKLKIKVLQTPAEFKADADSLESEIEGWNKKMLMAATKDKDQRLQLELIFYKKKKELRRIEQEDEAYDNLFKYEDSLDKLVKAGKMESSVAEKAKGDALLQTQEKVDLINGEHDRLIAKAEEATKALRLGFGEDDGEETRGLTQKEVLGMTMDVMNSFTDLMSADADRQIAIETNKTNKLNNALNDRLLNENLSKSQRKRIQLEIAQNDEKLRVKQEAIERKKFKLQKAANIAQAMISTYLAASQVAANPMLLDPVSKAIAMGATITTGLLNVASIAKQKFQSSAGGASLAGRGGGSGGNGGNDRSFNFNLAGASRENQLANTLQGRFDQPIQAFVVGRDITNQQQLDEDIRSNASFG